MEDLIKKLTMKSLSLFGILLLYFLLVNAQQDCEWLRTHTFEVKEGIKLSFTAKIEKSYGLVIDIIYKNKTSDRIELSPRKSTIHKYEKYKHTESEIDSLLNEGLQEMQIFVGISVIEVICTSSDMAPVSFSTHSRVKIIKIAALKLKICEESCKIETTIKKTIDKEDHFTITVFTQLNNPISLQISNSREDESIGEFEIRPKDCFLRWKYSNKSIQCDYINPGWNKLSIIVSKTTLVINNNIIIQEDITLKTIDVTGNYLVNCTRGNPKWKIYNQKEIKIPITLGQDLNLVLTSKTEFSPGINLDGNELRFSWQNGLKVSSAGNPLQPKSYNIIFESSSHTLMLYNKVHTGKQLMIELKVNKVPECITFSSLSGDYLLYLIVPEQDPYYQTTTDLSHTTINTEGDTSKSSRITKLLLIVVIVVVLFATIFGLIRKFQIVATVKSNAMKIRNNHLEMQPLLNSRGKVDLSEITKEYYQSTNPKHRLMKLYKLKLREDHHDPEKRVQKLSLGSLDPCVPTKTLLILGETGAGKSTTINAMVNYIFGIELTDKERIIMIENDADRRNYEYLSNTEFITAYVLPYKPGMPNHCNYIIIDTPGFADTRGFEQDKKILPQMENFLKQNYNISHIDVVGLVVKSYTENLNLAQTYVYDGLLSMFAKDICHNMFLIVTFAEKVVPPVLKALKDADIKYHDYFKLNNESLYCPYNHNESGKLNSNNHERIKFNWEISEDNLQDLFQKMQSLNPVSLSLTKIVLEEKTRLRSTVECLQNQIKEGLNKLAQLNVKQMKSTISGEIKQTEQEIIHTEELLLISIKEAQQLTERLKDIAIRPDPLSVHGYIEKVIRNELEERNPNFEERIRILEKLKEENDVLKEVMNKEQPPVDGWLHYFQKLKE